MSVDEEASALAITLERAARPLHRPFWLVGVMGVLCAAMGLAVAHDAGGVLGASLGVFLIVSAVRGVRFVRLNALLTGARNEMALGHLAIAEHLVARVSRKTAHRAYRRATHSLEGMIALRRGRLDKAIAELDQALAIPLARWIATDRAARFQVCGLRALTNAMRGDEEAARADIAAVRESALRENFGWRVVVNDATLGEPLARAALAEMLLAAKKGDIEALRASLDAHRGLVAERVNPRERVLLRAMERRARAEAGSVYRQVEVPPEVVDENEPAISEWVDRVAPEAAKFVRVAEPSTPRPAAADAPGPTARAPIPKRGRWTRERLIAILIVATLGIFAAWQAARTSHGSADVGRGELIADGFSVAFSLSIVPLVVIAVAAHFFVLSRQVRRLNIAFRRVVLEPETGREALAKVPVGSNAFLVAARALALARGSFERGDFSDALREAEDGLARMAPHARTAGFVEFLPTMSAFRAAALAALGREADANAEVAALPVAFSGRAAAGVRVALLSAVRRGDVGRAAEIAAGVTDDLPLDLRTEMLVDLVRATHGTGIAPLDLERLRQDVQAPAERAFFLAIAPQLLQELEPSELYVHPPNDEAAEREQEAEAEAQEPGRSAAKTR